MVGPLRPRSNAEGGRGPRLNRELNLILQRPDVRARLLTLGIEATPSTPQALDAFTREQYQTYVRLIKEFHIQPE